GFFGNLHRFVFGRQPILIEVGGAAFVIGAVAVIQRQRWQRQAVALLQSLHLQFIHRANQPFGAVKLSLGVGGIHIGQLLVVVNTHPRYREAFVQRFIIG